MKKDNKTLGIILASVGALLILWLSVLIAPTIDGGLPVMLPKLREAFSHPFRFSWCGNTLPCVLTLLAAYGVGLLICHDTKPNYRRREEHGSAKWGNLKEINRRYAQEPPESNKILTQNVCIGYDAHAHRRNLNTLVVGGSGAGKTRFYAKPNLMQANTSFVILDPKGELAASTGQLLKSQGYEVRVLDLINTEKSHCYNPFRYLSSENDVQRLVTNLFKSTTPKGSQSNDPFWDTAASMLLMSLVFTSTRRQNRRNRTSRWSWNFSARQM